MGSRRWKRRRLWIPQLVDGLGGLRKGFRESQRSDSDPAIRHAVVEIKAVWVAQVEALVHPGGKDDAVRRRCTRFVGRIEDGVPGAV